MAGQPVDRPRSAWPIKKGNYRLDQIHIVRITMVVSKLEFRYL